MKKHALLTVALTILAVGCAAFWAAHSLRIDAEWLHLKLPPTKEYIELKKAAELFPDEDLVVLALPAEAPFDVETLERFRNISARAGKEEHLWKVISPFIIRVPELSGDTLRSTLLIGSEPQDRIPSQNRILGSSLYSRLFLSEGKNIWKIYLAIDPNASLPNVLAALDNIKKEFPEIKVAGKPYYSALGERLLKKQFLPLLAGAALIILIINFFMVRVFLHAVLLWSMTLAPTILLLGLMAALGDSLTFHMVLAPSITLALATSYTTHMYRGWQACDCDSRLALKTRGRIIFLDVLTTIAGYLSLVVSPIEVLREIGWYSIAGAGFSVFIALVSLPGFLEYTRPTTVMPKRYRPSVGIISKRFVELKHSKLLILSIWIIAMGASIAAIPGLQIGHSYSELYMPGTEVRDEMEYIRNQGIYIEEISLVVETGKEYGLIDPILFLRLRNLEKAIESSGLCGTPYGYTDLVEEATALLHDKHDTSGLRTEAEIGEVLEILSGMEDGLFSRGFVDYDWSAAKFRIPVKVDFKNIRDMKTLRELSDTWNNKDGISIYWGGLVTEIELEQKAFIKGQIIGILLFLFFLAAILAFLFKSLGKALAAVTVSLAGLLASLGVIAFLGWRYSDVHALAIATVAGTGVDSAILMILHDFSKESSSAALDTSTLTIAALSVLLLSSSFLVFQTTILSIVGLAVSAATAHLILSLIVPNHSKKSGSKERFIT